jgi:beta-galactosidase
MRLWSLQAVARGADGVMFFQWRQSQSGAEKFHSAMVPHGTTAASPTWHEVVQLGEELRGLDAICGSRIRADVAILLDWESWWGLELPSKPSNLIQQIDQLEAYYRPFFEANVTVDFARPTDDLSGYKLVVAPCLYMVSDAGAANLSSYVEAGGNLLMTFFSGIVDPSEHIRLGGHPQPFIRVLGLRVLDWIPLGPEDTIGVRLGEGGETTGAIWSELIEAQGASVVATFTETFLNGHPAMTLNNFGAGTAQYVGTHLETSALARMLQAAWSRVGVAPVAEAPSGVEAVRRNVSDGSLLFLLNHGDAAVEVATEGHSVQLNGEGGAINGRVRLEPMDVVILHQSEVPTPA